MTRLERNIENVRQEAIEYIKNNGPIKKDALHRNLTIFSHQTRWKHLTTLLKNREWEPGKIITIDLLNK